MSLLTARIAALAACSLFAAAPIAANELEQSASAPDMVREQAYSSVDSRFGALKAATEALMQTQLQYLTSIKNCGAQKKLWDGSACVDALVETLTLTAPTVVTRQVSVEASRSYGPVKRCCKRIWGACVKDIHWHTEIYCTEKVGIDYTINMKTNTVNVINRTCSPRIIWAC